MYLCLILHILVIQVIGNRKPDIISHHGYSSFLRQNNNEVCIDNYIDNKDKSFI